MTDRPKSVGQAHRIIVQQKAEIERLRAEIKTAFQEGYSCGFDDWGNEHVHISEINAGMRAAWDKTREALNDD